jgi:hypothetical protein
VSIKRLGWAILLRRSIVAPLAEVGPFGKLAGQVAELAL